MKKNPTSTLWEDCTVLRSFMAGRCRRKTAEAAAASKTERNCDALQENFQSQLARLKWDEGFSLPCEMLKLVFKKETATVSISKLCQINSNHKSLCQPKKSWNLKRISVIFSHQVRSIQPNGPHSSHQKCRKSNLPWEAKSSCSDGEQRC